MCGIESVGLNYGPRPANVQLGSRRARGSSTAFSNRSRKPVLGHFQLPDGSTDRRISRENKGVYVLVASRAELHI